MYQAIATILALLTVCQGATVVSGPSTTTQELGARFTLKCSVADEGSDLVFWKLQTENEVQVETLTFGRTSAFSDHYEIETDTYNLIVKNATYQDDGVFQCAVGSSEKSARVYIYDKPETMTLDWEHSINKPGAVEPQNEYKLRCTTIHSYPPATHRYFKDGVELSNSRISYTYKNDTDSNIGYGDVTSLLPFTPSDTDINEVRTIRCVADLYNKLNASSIAFGINSASRTESIGLGAGLLITVVTLLSY